MSLWTDAEIETARPSSLARMIECPASRRLAVLAPQGPPSKWADEGTAAHKLGDLCLTRGHAPFEYFGRSINIEDRATYEVNEDMAGAVSHYVRKIRQHLKEAGANARHWVERKLFVPAIRNGGTVDSLIVEQSRQTVWVDDYKHGAGVYVSEKENAQMMAYALGAAHVCMPGRPLDEMTFHLTVHQPRFPDVPPARTFTLSGRRLAEWRDDVLIPRLEAGRSRDAEFRGGDHCRFCPGKPICTTYLTVQRPRFQHRPLEVAPVPPDLQF